MAKKSAEQAARAAARTAAAAEELAKEAEAVAANVLFRRIVSKLEAGGGKGGRGGKGGGGGRGGRGGEPSIAERSKRASAVAKAAAEAAKAAAAFESQEHGLGLSLGRTLRRLIESERAAAASSGGDGAVNGGDDGGRGLGGLAGLGEEGMRILRWHVANIEYSTGVRCYFRAVCCSSVQLMICLCMRGNNTISSTLRA